MAVRAFTPVPARPTLLPDKSAESQESAANPPFRILVVDDNEDNRALLEALLQGQGYAVECAASGHSALESVAANPPGLILLDVILPDLDGHEVARQIKADTRLPFIPVILVTAKGELQDKIYGLEQGADDFLSKPVNSGELMARVRALVRLKQAQDDIHLQHEELRTLHEQLRASEANRENLVQMITHDLRGPLTGMLGALELIEDGSLGPLTDDQQLFIRQSLLNAQTLNDMVGDLLDVYRLEAGHAELEREPVDLRMAADLACLQVEAAVASKKLVLNNSISADLPPISANPDKLVRVLANLLNNAFKYTERGTIVLTARQSEDNGYARSTDGVPPTQQSYLTIEVQDTGVGILPEARALIFEKFYQGRPRIPGMPTRGAGLGLHFCKHVVEAHGGNLWVDGRPDGGSGSVFSFSIPVYLGKARTCPT